MSDLYAVEIDDDYDNDLVSVEFNDGSVKHYCAKPLSRAEAIEKINNHIREKLKLEDAFDNLEILTNLKNLGNAYDYEVAQGLVDITGDYGYFIAFPNNTK